MKLSRLTPLALAIALNTAPLASGVSPVAWAQTESSPPMDLLSEAQIVQWLGDDPALQGIQARKLALQAQAAQTASSGYEWTASYSRQEREYRQPELAGADKSREWNLELERSLQLPGKGAASRREAQALRQLADADEQAGLRLAITELIDSYLDALHASASLALLQQELAFALANLHAVEYRVKAGDAPALDARLAAAESQALQQELSQAQQAAHNRWTSFRLRYPAASVPAFALALDTSARADDGEKIATESLTTENKPVKSPGSVKSMPVKSMPVNPTVVNWAAANWTVVDSPALQAIPTPRLVDGDLSLWQERLLSQQPALQQADASLKAASAAADKAKRERIPDPSIAVYSGRESFGEESVVGLRLSMPIPGSQRTQAMRQGYAEEAAARADKELLLRSLRAQAENHYRQTHSDYQRWQLATQMTNNLGENARLLHKAYRLGEQDLQGLLLGQQQHTRAALAEVESRVQALRSYYQLQIAAGELNPFASSTPINSSKTLSGNL
ncbi:TolC family protein [Cellvibrio sp. KY-GH-1]|uniref:TolC family protein n=1 Tax=Cellvibrio sp. KY-GH-1 TaxID=2303332 RepID=UPI0012445B7F|nr:TolC family protein [Cellvibrio sp. KY-GH-1]QEY16274.1 TolC family protein [Cellvibrio sp. KY-GH-1]